MAFGRRAGITTLGKGRLLADQTDAVWIPPRLTRRYPIVYCPPGFNRGDVGLEASSTPGQGALMAKLRMGGALVVTCDFDIGTPGFYGSSWGAPLARGHIETIRTSVAALAASLGVPNVGLLDASQIVLTGGSQGACDAFGYAVDYPTRTRAVGLWAAAVDLTGFYSGSYRWPSDAGTANQAAIGADWGVTPPSALPANADPLDNAAAVECPTLLAYSTADATTPAASATAMAAAVQNGTAIEVSTTAGHNENGAAAAADNGLAAWLLEQAT